MYKIMLVEDDTTITQVLARQLARWGYDVEAVTDFGHVMEQFNAFEPHLVLLDLSLPFFNGYHWCGEIRKISQTPVIFISSSGDDLNQVMALGIGADDFVAKPFSLEVITAKIQAILRRTYSFGGDKNLVTLGDVTLNLGESTVGYGKNSTALTKNELKMMQILMEAHGNVVTRDAMMRRLWETESFIDDNTLTVNVTRLRKKLSDLGLDGFIATQKGVGYAAQEGP